MLLISGVAASGSQSPSGAAAGCDTSGDPQVTTDKLDYARGETVVIAGSGFQCGAALIVTVTWPTSGVDSRVDSVGVVADQSGLFAHRYDLPDDALAGEYGVAVLDADGNVLASTVFYDSHFRFGHITWTQISGDTVEITFTIGMRRSAFGPSCHTIGNLCSFGETLHFGDAASISPTFTIIATNTDEDWVLGTATVQHTYSSSGPFTVFNSSCCRISPPTHINNPDANWRVEAIVDLRDGNTGSPQSNLSPIVECPINALCRFQIPVIEPDGQQVNFRLSTPGEMGASAITHPPGASIDTGSGLYSWDTTGATLNAGGQTLYSTQVSIVDLDSSGDVISKSSIDFFIRVATVVAAPTDALIGIPVRWCGVQGAPSMANPGLVGESSTKDVLWRRHERTSDNTYIRQADVTFRSGATRALPDFPVIPDRAGPGGAGDVFADPDTGNYTEVLQIVNDCRTAWTASAPKVTGLIAIHMGRFVDSGGNPTDLLGLGLDIQDRFPYWKAGGWAMVIDNAYMLDGSPIRAFSADGKDKLLGHEFGHALSLPHGDGVDNNSDNILDNEGDTLNGPNLMQYQ